MTCSKCGESNPLAKANKSRKTGEQLFRTHCVMCEKQRKAVWITNNKEHHNAKCREWTLKNPEKRKEIRKKWQEHNAPYFGRRKEFVRKATPKWANGFFIKEIYSLAKLRSTITKITWHVDHVIPLQHPLVCGLHVENNLQVIPAVDNMKKGNKYAIL